MYTCLARFINFDSFAHDIREQSTDTGITAIVVHTDITRGIMPDMELSDHGSLNIKMRNFMLRALVRMKGQGKATDGSQLFNFTDADVEEVKKAKYISENLKPRADWKDEKQ